MGMKKQTSTKNVWITAAVVVCLAAAVFVFYFFQHESVNTGRYTVVYYKNRCAIDPQTLPADLDSLKALPCLIRINWTEQIASDMEQEYCYYPGRGIEATRRIYKNQ